MRRAVLLILIVVLSLPSFAAPKTKQSKVLATVTRVIVRIQSRLSPPWPAPAPEPPPEAATTTTTLSSRVPKPAR